MKKKSVELDAYEQEIDESTEYRAISPKSKMMLNGILEKEIKLIPFNTTL